MPPVKEQAAVVPQLRDSNGVQKGDRPAADGTLAQRHHSLNIFSPARPVF